MQREKTGIGDRWETRSQGDDLNVIVRQKQNWRPWWNLDVIVNVKRKTGIGDRWETRSQGDDLNVIARQTQNWRHGGN